MRGRVDLHTHSTASDGSLSPAALVRAAAGAALEAIALTDHDTLAGIPEARREAERLGGPTILAGVELSARLPTTSMHLLGLGVDPKNAELTALIERLAEARRQRNPQMVERLRAMGVELSLDDVRAAAGEEPGGPPRAILSRMHFALALQAKGYVHGPADAFRRYIGESAPAFVDKERLSPAEVFRAVHAAGGLAALAHPVHLACENDAQRLRVLKRLRSDGLDAVEVYHSDHDARLTRSLLETARRLGLGVVGGSDFHGVDRGRGKLGRPTVPLSAVDRRLRERLGL